MPTVGDKTPTAIPDSYNYVYDIRNDIFDFLETTFLFRLTFTDAEADVSGSQPFGCM